MLMTKMIFGVGNTLYNNWKYIKKYYNPDLAVDNNPEKWGKIDEFTGLKCIAPNDILSYTSPEMLITVGDPYSAECIKNQLYNMSIKATYLIEMIKEWSVSEPISNEINIHNENKKIWLLNTPEHDNLGDHLIAESELELIKKIKPEYEVIEVTDMEYLWHREKLRAIITKKDLLVITGGGFLGSMWLYNAENTVREIITDYPDNKVVILPQTIFFENNERGKKEFLKTSRIYNNHDKLTICLREKKSYEILKTMLSGNSKLHLLPDMGLFFDYDVHVKRRENIGICFRNDKESTLCADDKKYIIQIAKMQATGIKFISTHSGKFDDRKNRAEQIEKKMQEIASMSLIITDTLHCMIFAALCGIPCIAFDNVSNKVSNVYEWIKELKYVKICTDLYDIDSMIHEMISRSGKFELPNREKYEEEIKKILDN